MTTFLKVLVLFLLAITAPGCHDLPKHYFSPTPDCNSHTIQVHEPLSAAYQTQVVEILKNKRPEDFRYFFKTFIDEKDSTGMLVNFRNDSLCFDVKMLIKNWEKLEGMHKTNGRSYPQELYDLNWHLVENKIVYLDMHEVID